MFESTSTKTSVKIDDQREANDAIAFLNSLDTKDKNSLCVFLQGVRFAQSLATTHTETQTTCVRS